MGEKEPLFLSTLLGWVDLKVAGMSAIGSVISLLLCVTSVVGHCHIYGFGGGLLIHNCITFYDKNQCKMVVIGAVPFSLVTGCISKSPSQSAQQQSDA